VNQATGSHRTGIGSLRPGLRSGVSLLATLALMVMSAAPNAAAQPTQREGEGAPSPLNTGQDVTSPITRIDVRAGYSRN
jgi:hypothetical protein